VGVRIARRVAFAGAALVVMLATAGCGGSPPVPHALWDSPRPAPSVPEGDDGAAPSGTPSVAPSDALAARIPKFGPPPAPQPVPVPPGAAAPIFKHLPITQPVAFLTIDDGWIQLPDDERLMQDAHIPFTMFLIGPVAAKNPAFFQHLVASGGVIEDHTMTHPSLKGASYDFQHREICDARTSLAHTFGTTPRLFRPPFGNYDSTTLRVVHDCGLTAAFYWSETVNNGTVYYQTPEHRIHPGDIILMHFRPAFVADVLAALNAIHSAGLTPALLENYFP
jgi:peptidoglycan/xylan/chitin deacetylase (PgdA/CDA1 family)